MQQACTTCLNAGSGLDGKAVMMLKILPYVQVSLLLALQAQMPSAYCAHNMQLDMQLVIILSHGHIIFSPHPIIKPHKSTSKGKSVAAVHLLVSLQSERGQKEISAARVREVEGQLAAAQASLKSERVLLQQASHIMIHVHFLNHTYLRVGPLQYCFPLCMHVDCVFVLDDRVAASLS